MASEKATKESIPLVVLFVISPQDYAAHDRSARRIDFTLRNLEITKVRMRYPISGVCLTFIRIDILIESSYSSPHRNSHT